MSQVRVLLVDAAVVILETQTAGSSAITLIPSSLPPPLPLSTHQTTRAYTLDGRNSKSQNRTPALEYLHLPSNNDDDDAPVSEALRQLTPVPPLRPFRFLCSPSSGCLRCSGVQVVTEVRFPGSCANFQVTRTAIQALFFITRGEGRISQKWWVCIKERYRAFAGQVTTVWRGQKYQDAGRVPRIPDAPLDSSGAGPAHVRFICFHLQRFITLSQPNHFRLLQAREHFSRSSYSVRVTATDTASLIAP